MGGGGGGGGGGTRGRLTVSEQLSQSQSFLLAGGGTCDTCLKCVQLVTIEDTYTDSTEIMTYHL